MATGIVIVLTVKFVYDRDKASKNFKEQKYKEIVAWIEKDKKVIRLFFKMKFGMNADDKIK